VVLFSPDVKISIRRKPDTNIRCDLIASKLEGGAHSYTAGAIIRRKITRLMTITRAMIYGYKPKKSSKPGDRDRMTIQMQN
jgi:nanoRNase/pAp phosphatase (c-di-AMP/oligoRNAs hydrolase)